MFLAGFFSSCVLDFVRVSSFDNCLPSLKSPNTIAMLIGNKNIRHTYHIHISIHSTDGIK